MSNCRAEATRRFEAVRPTQLLNWFWHPNFWSGPAVFGASDAQLARQLTIGTTAEYLPVWDFFMTCDELGMPGPLANLPPDPVNHPNWLADPENPLHGDELLRFSDLPAALALAQHLLSLSTMGFQRVSSTGRWTQLRLHSSQLSHYVGQR
jgi:hypothetical protein